MADWIGLLVPFVLGFGTREIVRAGRRLAGRWARIQRARRPEQPGRWRSCQNWEHPHFGRPGCPWCEPDTSRAGAWEHERIE